MVFIDKIVSNSRSQAYNQVIHTWKKVYGRYHKAQTVGTDGFRFSYRAGNRQFRMMVQQVKTA